MNVQMEEYIFSNAKSSEKNFIKNTTGYSEPKNNLIVRSRMH
jgi:hypothetical protein